jgi:hypothetical protein
LLHVDLYWGINYILIMSKEVKFEDIFGEEKKKELVYIQISDRITLDAYKELEENGVYIHYIPEHYTDGSNLNFSIEFKNQNT